MNYPCGLNSVDTGHVDVHENDVGRQPAGEFNHLVAVTGLADNLNVRFKINKTGEAVTEEGVVVGNKDADKVCLVFGFVFRVIGGNRFMVKPMGTGWSGIAAAGMSNVN